MTDVRSSSVSSSTRGGPRKAHYYTGYSDGRQRVGFNISRRPGPYTGWGEIPNEVEIAGSLGGGHDLDVTCPERYGYECDVIVSGKSEGGGAFIKSYTFQADGETKKIHIKERLEEAFLWAEIFESGESGDSRRDSKMIYVVPLSESPKGDLSRYGRIKAPRGCTFSGTLGGGQDFFYSVPGVAQVSIMMEIQDASGVNSSSEHVDIPATGSIALPKRIRAAAVSVIPTEFHEGGDGVPTEDNTPVLIGKSRPEGEHRKWFYQTQVLGDHGEIALDCPPFGTWRYYLKGTGEGWLDGFNFLDVPATCTIEPGSGDNSISVACYENGYADRFRFVVTVGTKVYNLGELEADGNPETINFTAKTGGLSFNETLRGSERAYARLIPCKGSGKGIFLSALPDWLQDTEDAWLPTEGLSGGSIDSVDWSLLGDLVQDLAGLPGLNLTGALGSVASKSKNTKSTLEDENSTLEQKGQAIVDLMSAAADAVSEGAQKRPEIRAKLDDLGPGGTFKVKIPGIPGKAKISAPGLPGKTIGGAADAWAVRNFILEDRYVQAGWYAMYGVGCLGDLKDPVGAVLQGLRVPWILYSVDKAYYGMPFAIHEIRAYHQGAAKTIRKELAKKLKEKAGSDSNFAESVGAETVDLINSDELLENLDTWREVVDSVNRSEPRLLVQWATVRLADINSVALRNVKRRDKSIAQRVELGWQLYKLGQTTDPVYIPYIRGSEYLAHFVRKFQESMSEGIQDVVEGKWSDERVPTPVATWG